MPVFTIPDMSVKIRLLVGAILEKFGAQFVDIKDPSAAYVGCGSEVSPSVFRPLKRGPTVEVRYEEE